MRRMALLFLFFIMGFPTSSSAQEAAPPIIQPVPSLTLDDYGVNSSRYNTCYPQIEFSAQFLSDTPALLCLIDGYREANEKKSTSRFRAEKARNFLVSHFGIEPERVLIRDRGTEKPAHPLLMEFIGEKTNRRIVITFLKPMGATDRKAKVQPNFVFDYYWRKNMVRYDTCYPTLSMAGNEINKNQNLFCLLEGHRSKDERNWVSKKRSERARFYLLQSQNLHPNQILLRDGGIVPLSPAKESSPENPMVYRFLAISLLEPAELHKF